MEDSTLHQGIFIQKPKSSKRKQAINRIQEESIKALGEPVGTANLRYKAFSNHWEHVHSNLQDLEKKWHKSLVEEISTFIETNSSAMFESELVTPIGFLQTGLSADENMNLFESITDAIKNGVSPHVARLKSTMCPNVKTAFQNICKQLMTNNVDVSRFNETGASNLGESFSSITNDDQIGSNNRYLSMHDLQKWYETKYTNYFKNELTKNSPAFRDSKRLVVSISRLDHSNMCSPSATPKTKPSSWYINSNSTTIRKSLFSPHSQNEIANIQVPEKRRKTVNEIKVESCDLSSPKKSERTLRSSSSQKNDKIDEDKLYFSTPSKSVNRASRCFVDSPLSKNPNDIISSPILPKIETPKRGRASVSCNTPKRHNTPSNRIGNPRCNIDRVLPIVLVIDDVDYFPANVIQQIFQLLSCAKLPLILVVGVIHYYESFNRFVPQQCSTTLMYKTFSTVTASTRLNDFFHSVMYMAEFPLILSGRIVQYLSDYFLLHHFSITRLLQAYKLCLLDYYRLPESLLCVKDLEDVLSEVSSEDLFTTIKTTNIDASKSMRLRTPTKGKVVPSIGIKTDILCEIIGSFHPSCVNWFASLCFLYGLCGNLPNSPLGKDMRETYINSFYGDLFSEYDEGQSRLDVALIYMGHVQQTELRSRLERSIKTIYDFINGKKVKETEFVSKLIEDIERFIEKLDNVKEQENKLAKEELNNDKVPPLKIKKTKNLYELQKSLMTGIDKKKGISSVFTSLRRTVIGFVKKTVHENLRSFPSNLEEIFVYDNLSYVKQHFSPSLQEKVHKALLLPGNYLKCECCRELSSGSIEAAMPDTSIVYKMLLEKPFKTLDLNAIYESFVSVVEVKTAKKRKGVKNEHYLLRFRQVVAELQHMGFILRSKTKPDEVVRLAW